MGRRSLKLKKKRRDAVMRRWVVLGIFGVMALVSLGFWWQGSLEEQISDYFDPEPAVWRKDRKLETKDGEQIEVGSERIKTDKLEEQIGNMVKGLKGKYVVYAKSFSVKQNWEFSFGNINQTMQAASLIKLPVMVGVYRMAERGELDLDMVYKLREEDRVGGSGSLVGKPEGYEVTWKKLVWHMGNESDNTAFTAVVNLVGKEKLKDELMRMGLLEVSIEKNQITPREMVKLFEGLFLNEWLGKEDSEEILFSMMQTWYEDRIPVGVPESVRVMHKVGTEIGVVSDVGIVYADEPYLLLMMTEDVREVEAREVLPKISRVVWEWNSNIPWEI